MGAAALAFYCWAVRRERKLRELATSAAERAEPNRIAGQSELRPPYRVKPAMVDEVDVLTGGVTL